MQDEVLSATINQGSFVHCVIQKYMSWEAAVDKVTRLLAG